MGIVLGKRAWVGHRPRLKAFRDSSPPCRGFRPAARIPSALPRDHCWYSLHTVTAG